MLSSDVDAGKSEFTLTASSSRLHSQNLWRMSLRAIPTLAKREAFRFVVDAADPLCK
jgi:hypothetical protein